jgi:hypothetical protein
MRAKEFLTEIGLNVPNQMITVQIPLSDIISTAGVDDSKEVINPGKRPGKDGKYKWSPPLQQHLDVTKDAVGTTDDEISVHDSEVHLDTDEVDDESDFKKQLISLLSEPPAML